jgi:hypothetical protein
MLTYPSTEDEVFEDDPLDQESVRSVADEIKLQADRSNIEEPPSQYNPTELRLNPLEEDHWDQVRMPPPPDFPEDWDLFGDESMMIEPDSLIKVEPFEDSLIVESVDAFMMGNRAEEEKIEQTLSDISEEKIPASQPSVNDMRTASANVELIQEESNPPGASLVGLGEGIVNELQPAVPLAPSSLDSPIRLPPYLLSPSSIRESERGEVRMVTVVVRSTGDKMRDVLRLRRIHGMITSYPGEDRFAFHVFERGRGYLLEFPNFTAGVCDELLERLRGLVGSDNVRVERITFQ